MQEFVKIISIIGISSVKFVGGPILSAAYKYSYLQTILYTVVGGMCGVVTISYISPFAIKMWRWFRMKKAYWKFNRKLKSAFSTPHMDISHKFAILYTQLPSLRKKTIFSTRNRRIVKYWKKFGLMGIALFTPIFISIPVGTFIATKYVPNRKKVLLYMFCSLVFWAVLLTSIFEYVANKL